MLSCCEVVASLCGFSVRFVPLWFNDIRRKSERVTFRRFDE